MFETRNDLSPTVREKAVGLLNARPADCVDLHTQVKHAHWDVRGPAFIAVHKLFRREERRDLECVDDIDERAVKLEGIAHGTARSVARRSSLGEYPAAAAAGRERVEALSTALAAFGKAVRKGIEEANELGDLDTADLFAEVSRGIDRWLRFLVTHARSGS